MQKRVERKEDGRKIIYYTFPEEETAIGNIETKQSESDKQANFEKRSDFEKQSKSNLRSNSEQQNEK